MILKYKLSSNLDLTKNELEFYYLLKVYYMLIKKRYFSFINVSK